jgi:phosphatidylserine/phosphatidylglycerophosphate/cardiolipin synthase-like enzyme
MWMRVETAHRSLLSISFQIKLFLILGLIIFSAVTSQAQERLCDNSFEDCRTPLWKLIDSETQQIDVAFWFMQDSSYATKLIARKNAGVTVRVIVDPRANPTYSGNAQILDQLQAAGIPMRYKLNEGILHNKAMIFAAQGKVEFSGANYNAAFEPFTPYTNYQDEVIYFTDDPSVVNSFKTKYDDLWTDTTMYGNYANISGPLTRSYPTFPIDPELNFPPSADGSQDFRNRTVQHINQETQKVDAIIYRITNQDFTNAMIGAAARGLTVRLMTEPDQYRDPERLWHSWNVDRMYMAGVEVKHRKHMGLNHQKTVLFYSQGMTAFGSSNWTGPSSNYQQEHNYFTTKPWFFQFFVNEFERKWNSSIEMEPFVPLPPDAPTGAVPANNATNQLTTVTLQWEGGYWAHKYDIYFGTNSTPPLIASNVETGTPGPGAESFTVSGLAPGTTYFWRIVGKTMADRTASSSLIRFTTQTGSAPVNPPTVTSILPATGSSFGGTIVTITGTNFANGATVSFGGVPATNVSVLSSTSISARAPAHAIGPVDVVVANTDGGRGALANAFTYTGTTTAPAPMINLISPETGAPSGGTTVTITGANFISGATVMLGGVPATNVVVSNNGYTITATAGSSSEGTVNVTVTNPDNQSATRANCFKYTAPLAPPTITSISPNTGASTGGTLLTISGTNFNYGATVKLDGVLATTITVVNNTTITARTVAHGAGAVDVVVTNYQGPSVTLTGGFTYNPPSSTAPTISSVSPNSGPTDGGATVTITGTRFVSGATVNFGGTAATNVNVTSATSITATTPARNPGTVSVTVTNPNNESATLNNAYTYVSSSTATDIVLYASEATVKVGSFAVVNDPTAAGGATIHNTDVGAPKLTNALANPSHYFEMSFTAQGGVPYRLWTRSKADNNSPFNDSYFIQFSDSVDAGNTANYRIGTTDSTVINLEDCSGCGLSGWGWQDNGWGVGVMGPLIYFQSTGTHTLRLQPREDGFSIDQIVFSPQTYLNSAPGALKNDTTILPETGVPPAAVPTVSSVTPNSGTTAGGTSVSITGTNFANGATVSFGGTAASNVNVTNSTTITATTPAHAAGAVSIVVTNPDNQSGTLANGFTYNAPSAPAPTVSTVSPTSGTTAGGTAVTITGTNFVSGATISFGGTTASNINVTNSTTITAMTPAHAAGAVNVVVTNPDTQSGSLTNGFTYTTPSAPAPTVSAVTPNSGTTAGGTAVTITGTNFVSGATVSFGGAAAAGVNVTNPTTITATTPAHAAGAVNVVVINPDTQSGTLTGGFTYTGAAPSLPTFGHVFVVVEENHSFSSVIGNSAMPYLNTLATRYGQATSYYANTHPSIGNYFWLTTGQVVTNDSNFAGTTSVDNIVRQLLAAGKTWKSYAESLPSVGYTGSDQYPYVKRHNPFAYITDVLNSPPQTNRLVPFSQFATDLSNLQLPNYSFIIPNQLNNAHDCPASNPSCTDNNKLAAADNWLKTNIDPLIASPTFQQDGLLVIVFDESVDTDTVNGGGHIAMLVISPQAKQNYQATTLYQHENTLRLLAEGLGLTTFPGASATASNMAEFFGGSNTAPIINSITPNSGSTAGGTAITINGTGFVTTASVTVGGVAATNVTVVGSTTITATTPAHAAGAVNVVVSNPNSQSVTLANGFTYTSSSPETVLLADDFNDNLLDSAKLVNNNVFSGFTDSTVVVSEASQQLKIGPLKQNVSGSHYNGIRSTSAYNFTGGYVYVELVQSVVTSTTADAMLTIGKDANNYYRIYTEGGNLICQKKTNGAKVDLFNMPYDAVAHRFLRIRHDSATGNVIFETATGSGGAPGTWIQRATQAWDTAAVPLAVVAFELKAGTWQVEATAPGTVIFDNFKAAKP